MSNEPQVIFNMPRADYDRRGEVNWSTLKLLGKSPAHYHAALLETDSEDTDARQRGRAVHTAVLEPEKYRTEYVTWNGGPRNPKSQKWIDFKAEHAGKEIITETMSQDSTALANAVRSTAAAMPYLSGGKSEVTCIWPFVRETLGGVEGYTTMCRSRLDFVANVGAIVDLKTTRDASPSGFGREVARYSYHVQAAYYRAAYFACTGKLLPYVFVAVEATRPHVTQVYRVTEQALELGTERFTELHDLLHRCRSDNHWPGYGEGIMDLELPAWLMPDDDESDDLSGLLTREAA